MHFSLLFSFFSLITCESSPNIIFILTDDVDLTLNSVNSMKNTVKLIANRGITFTNAYVNSPICCPSRSSILTGKLPATLQVFNNSLTGGCSSSTFQKIHEPSSTASLLKKHKQYSTFYAGKYLNQYGNAGLDHVPQGYDWWIGLKGNSKYYNYSLSLNGTSKRFRNSYFTDKITKYALKFIQVQQRNRFFMMIAPPAAHAPFTPAPRHSKMFNNVIADRKAPFNCTPVDKHWLVEMGAVALPQNVSVLDEIHRNRLRTLQAVDEMVRRIVKKLEKLRILEETFIVFSSDNGFHIGQFAMPWDKRQPYESDIHVPFLIRGPGIFPKTFSNFPISAVDISPTLLELAGITHEVDFKTFDGSSFKKEMFLQSQSRNYEKFIQVQYWGESNPNSVDPRCGFSESSQLAECSVESWCKCQDSRNNTYSCLLHVSESVKVKFCRFVDGFHEVYDLVEDRFEINNIYGQLTSEELGFYRLKLNRKK